MLDPEITAASERLVAALRSRGWRIATAESCTGGLLAGAITAVAGSSAVFGEGFVTYSNAAKQTWLGVPSQMLDTFGAVSAEVAQAMAGGLRERTGADLCVSVTGIAGPGGATAAKPVGLVHFALATTRDVETFGKRFGDIGRSDVRRASVLFALESALTAVARS